MRKALRTRLNRECRGKVKYWKESHAAKDAAQFERLHNGSMNHYRCQWCGYYHIGHTPREVLQEIYGDEWPIMNGAS